MSSGADTLGKYQIIREIARSNDIVYEAYDPAMNRRVALKELAAPPGATEKQRRDRLARFQREAKAAGSLTHPNIVTIYEVGEDRGRAYIAMEYLEGQNLRQRLDAEGFLPQEETVEIIVEVLDALAYAHAHGVIHRDIKPDNIQLLPDGRVKITDFGIARLMFEPSLTVDGQIFGTPSYMSPEQVVGREIDVRTDIWSCGVVLYEAICGKKPFSGDSVVSISHAIMHLDPPDPPQASFSIAQIVRRAMEKPPDQRFANAKAMSAALVEALEALKRDPAVAGAPPGSVYARTTHPPSPWGAPLDPYGPQPTPYGGGTPPIYSSPGSPYGQPYDPYGTPYGQGAPPAGSVPPPPYPPGWINPPRGRPLLSPEAAEFLRRTLNVILVGGAIIAVGIAGVIGLNTVAERQQEEQLDKRYVRAMEDAKRLGVSDATAGIEKLLDLEPVLRSERMIKQLRREIAALYLKRGERFARAANWIAALEDFQRAAEQHPSDHHPFAAWAQALGEMAARETDTYARIGLLEEANAKYETAIRLAGSSRAANEYREKAGRMLIRLAREYLGQGRLRDAELSLHRAVADFDAAGSTQGAAEARGLLRELSG